MKKIIIKILIFLTIVLIIDFLWGLLFTGLIEKSEEGRYFKAKYTLEKTNEDVLIIGSSLGEAGYCSQIFEDSLGISCFNTSREGQLLPYYNCVVKATLKRYSPSYVIFDVHPTFLQLEPNSEIAGEVFNPFYRKHPEIQMILNDNKKNKHVIHSSNLYAFNSTYLYVLIPFLKSGIDRKMADKGWRPRYGSIKESKEIDVLYGTDKINTNALKQFNAIMDSLLNNGVHLIFCSSPMYNAKIENTNTIKYVKEYARKNNIPYFDYSNNIDFVNENLYYKDKNHFNNVGAIKFSSCIAHDIKEYYKQQKN